jgi:hypothetical protein
VHTLKGVSGNIGANTLHQKTVELEHTLKSKQHSDLDSIFTEFEIQLKPVLNEIKEFKSNLAVASKDNSQSEDGVLDLDFDWPNGPGQLYLNGLSFGTTGFTFQNGVHVPLDFDLLYKLTLGNLPGWFGSFDGAGHASSTLPIPRDPSVLGLTVYMGFLTADATTHEPLAATAPVNITIDA